LQNVSIAVLGTGFWGGEWLRAIASVEGVTVAATAGHHPSLPPETELAPDYRHYTDYKQAIDDTPADAVLVVLPVGLHAEAVLRALKAGRHVICEKPVATNTDEVTALVAAATASDRVVMVNQNYRWRPWARFVRSKIAEGLLGEVAHINVRFSQPEILLGGRGDLEFPLLQDMSIHHFDLLRYLTGKNAVELYARAHRPPWSKYTGAPGLDAVITMEDDIQVSYSGSWAGRGRATTWDGDWSIQGDRGLLTMTDGLLAYYLESAGAELAPAGNSTAQPVLLDIPPLALGDLQSSLHSFRMAIESKEAPETDLRDNQHSIAIVYAAEESVRIGQPVQIGTSRS